MQILYYIKYLLHFIIVKRRHSIYWNLFIYTIKLVSLCYITYLLYQQLSIFYDIWIEKEDEFNLSKNEYDFLQCENKMHTTKNQIFKDECSQLKEIMKKKPFNRALIKMFKDYHSCITIPCSSLFNIIIHNTLYKLLFIAISFTIFYYLYHIILYTYHTVIYYQDKIRSRETKEIIKNYLDDISNHSITKNKVIIEHSI